MAEQLVVALAGPAVEAGKLAHDVIKKTWPDVTSSTEALAFNALPPGAECVELRSWNPWRRVLRLKDLKTKSLKVLRTQVEIQYRCSWKFGGQWNKRGHYICNVLPTATWALVRAGNRVQVSVQVLEPTMQGHDVACVPLHFQTNYSTKRKAKSYDDYVEICGDGNWTVRNAGAYIEGPEQQAGDP